MNWFDLLIIIILLLSMIRGFKRSFIKIILGFLGGLLSWIFALRYTNNFSNFLINNLHLYNTFLKFFKNINYIPEEIANKTAILEIIEAFISTSKLPNPLKQSIMLFIKQNPPNSVMSVKEYLDSLISNLSVKGVSFILIFIISFIIFEIILGIIFLKIKQKTVSILPNNIKNSIIEVAYIFFIIIFLLNAYTYFGLSILIPSNYLINIINNSLFLKISSLFFPLFGGILKFIGMIVSKEPL